MQGVRNTAPAAQKKHSTHDGSPPNTAPVAQNDTHTLSHACHVICTLSLHDAALTMRFAENTQQHTSKVLRLPRKMTSKVLRLPRKMQLIFLNRRKSIAPAAQNDFLHVMKHAGLSRSATPATRNEAMRHLKPPRVTTFAELAIGTAIRASRDRLRAVADGCATSGEHSLHPQTPRVKREPVLCIREKQKLIKELFGFKIIRQKRPGICKLDKPCSFLLIS